MLCLTDMLIVNVVLNWRWYIFSLDMRRKQLIGGLKHLVTNELECFDGPPPQEYQDRFDEVVDHSLSRAIKITSATDENG